MMIDNEKTKTVAILRVAAAAAATDDGATVLRRHLPADAVS